MTEYKVRIPIQGIVDLKTDEAEAKMRRMEQASRTSSSPAAPNLPPTIFGEHPTARAGSAFTQSFGQNFSFLQNRRQINTLIRQEHQTVRDLAEQYERVKHLQDDAGKQQSGHIKRQIDHHRSLAQAMRTVQMVGEGRELANRGEVMPGSGLSGSRMPLYLRQMTLRQALQGGAFTGGAGGIGRAVMSNPLLSMIAAGVGGPVLAYHLANKFSEPSEMMQLTHLDAARRMGTGNSLLPIFSDAEGGVGARFRKLGFSQNPIARMLSAYAIPGPAQVTDAAITEQAKFARRFGFGQNPEMISGMGREVSLMGLPPTLQASFQKMMSLSVAAAQKFGGVDSQDSLKGIMALLAQISQNTGLLTPDRMRAALTMAELGSQGGRVFSGAAGNARFGSMMDRFRNPTSIQGQALMNNIVMQAMSGQLPSGDELGLDREQAQAFDAMHMLQKSAFLRQNMDSIQGGFAHTFFRGLSRSTPKALKMQMLQSMQGLNETQATEYAAGLAKIAGPHADASRPFENLAALYGTRAQTQITMRRLRALEEGFIEQDLPGNRVSPIERSRASVERLSDLLSKGVSDKSLGLRTDIKTGVEETVVDAIVGISTGIPQIAEWLGKISRVLENTGLAFPFLNTPANPRLDPSPP